MEICADLKYDTKNPARIFDLFFQKENITLPLIIMIHGGGWISGDKSMYHDEATWFVKRGFAVACVAYRLAPLHPFPDAISDIQAMVKFAKENPGNLPFDSNQVIAMGNSAGGHLACMAGLLDHDLLSGEASPRTDGFISIAPITDIRNPNESQFPIAMSFLEQFMGKTHHESPEDYALASPITHADKNAPPSLIIHGDADDIVPFEQSKLLYEKLCQSGSPSELHILPNEGHSYTLPAWHQIRELSLDYLRTL